MLISLFFGACLFALSGCGGQSHDDALIHDDDTVLVLVDGQPVTLPMLEFMMSTRGIAEDDHPAMRELLEELIRLRAVSNAARREGMDQEPQVRARRMIRDLETLQLRYFDQVYRDHPVTDEDIEAVYRGQLERAGDRQFRIETILYGNQAEALANLARVEDGESTFPELAARARSMGLPVDAPVWVDRSQMPEDVAILLSESDVGEVVGLPLQTPQGWRVIRLTETRPIAAPDLDEVREGIARHLVRQRLEALVEDLYEAAEVTPMLPLDEVGD
ncbi:MAG: peptidylprolyl isomerase [Wenzhouxiangella sp.]